MPGMTCMLALYTGSCIQSHGHIVKTTSRAALEASIALLPREAARNRAGHDRRRLVQLRVRHTARPTAQRVRDEAAVRAKGEERGRDKQPRRDAADEDATMTAQRSLAGRTILMSGGSRGIGLAIGVRAARDGANVVLLAKTDKQDHRLEGTIHSAVARMQEEGGQALGIVGDVRRDEDVARAVKAAVDVFGGIDAVVNNASAIDLRSTRCLDMKRYDLMQSVNARGAFLLAKMALPHLEQSDNGHVLTLSPPIDLHPRWAGAYLGYTIAKCGMSLVTLGLAEELRGSGIAANSLWPRTTIATAAVRHLLGGEEAVARARTVEIMADAAHAVLTRDSRSCTGRFLIDEEVLAEEGTTDLGQYRVTPGEGPLDVDLFLMDRPD